jgi:hypothetical protein
VLSQGANPTKVDYQGALTGVACVADVTQGASRILVTDILSRLPQSFTLPIVGKVTLGQVTLNGLTLGRDGNFNGQLSITFDYQLGGKTQSVTIQANIKNNQLSLTSDNPLVSQYITQHKLAQQWQPFVNAALSTLRVSLMPVYFAMPAA